MLQEICYFLLQLPVLRKLLYKIENEFAKFFYRFLWKCQYFIFQQQKYMNLKFVLYLKSHDLFNDESIIQNT